MENEHNWAQRCHTVDFCVYLFCWAFFWAFYMYMYEYLFPLCADAVALRPARPVPRPCHNSYSHSHSLMPMQR